MLDLLTPSRAFVASRCGKWDAWHDFTRGTVPTLYVTGECTADIRDVKVVLRRAAVQGTNPRVLILDTIVEAASGARAQAAAAGVTDTPLPVRYDEPTKVRYTQIHVRPGDVFIDVRVSS